MNTLRNLGASMFLMMCFMPSSWAQVIHWELDGTMSTEQSGTDSNNVRTFSGGFDYNTVTDSLSNVTIASTGGPGCYLCFDYSGAAGSVRRDIPPFPPTPYGFDFSKTVDSAPPTFRTNFLFIGGYPLDFSNPGTSTVDINEESYFFVDGGVEDIDVHDFCAKCGTLIGTIAAVPEPETYAMLLAGLGILSVVSKRKRKTSIS
jgi:hypothetical protein